ncbi:MAG: hypothetical protein HQL32_16670 [Planctomycetes bacterium]|nr:hypothetical protein [Planctomycetota bacterium]
MNTSYLTGWVYGKAILLFSFSKKKTTYLPKNSSYSHENNSELEKKDVSSQIKQELSDLKKEIERLRKQHHEMMLERSQVKEKLSHSDDLCSRQASMLVDMKKSINKLNLQISNLRKQVRSKDVAYNAIKLELLALRSLNKDLEKQLDLPVLSTDKLV